MISKGKVDCMETLQGYVDEGLIRAVRHETLPLTLYNYTDKCTYGRHWDSYTKMCRGLILDDEGTVIARPFDKFFNLSELSATEGRALINDSNYECYDKLDGSLGIIWNYGGKWNVSTRGSFESPQAVKAQEILSKYNWHHMNPMYTYMCEIIYPDNRIVMDYGEEEKLVFLGARQTTSGENREPIRMPFPVAAKVGDRLVQLQQRAEMQTWDEGEGWVVYWPEKDVRVKIKTQDYLRVHKLKFLQGPNHIWELMLEGTWRESIQALPEEFREEAEGYQKQFEKYYRQMRRYTNDYYYTRIEHMDKDAFKDKAVRIQKEAVGWAQPALLAMMRGNNPRGYLYKLMKPTGNEMPDVDQWLGLGGDEPWK